MSHRTPLIIIEILRPKNLQRIVFGVAVMVQLLLFYFGLSAAARLLLLNTGARISRPTTSRIIHNALLRHLSGGNY